MVAACAPVWGGITCTITGEVVNNEENKKSVEEWFDSKCNRMPVALSQQMTATLPMHDDYIAEQILLGFNKVIEIMKNHVEIRKT